MLVRHSATRFVNHVQPARFMSSLVIAERSSDNTITGGTLSTIQAATQLGGPVTVLLTNTSESSKVPDMVAQVAGVAHVMFTDHPAYDHWLAENMTDLITACHAATPFTHILAPSSNATKNFIPRVGAKLDVAPLTDVLAILDTDTFDRPTYAGNAIARVRSRDSVKVMTVRPTAFEKAAIESQATRESKSPAPVPSSFDSDSDSNAPLSTFVSEQKSESDRPELTAARVVIAGGRGMKSGENFALLETLADKLGGAVGASRAAVDAGYVPNEYQVGQTGKVVAPDLYVAVGISGAIQHLAGMKDSKTIVCINKDEEAPIFQVSDYGLVDDLFRAIPDVTSKV